jgi:uncharacterized phage protein (TIGR01671 family)
MSREIKFRAWTDEGMINVRRITFAGDIVYVVSDNDDFDGCEFQISIDNLMQFTGLTDENGVEIYERDILLANGEWSTYVRRFSEHPDCLMVGSGGGEYDYEILSAVSERNAFEVIGNIHEHPHLLEGAA